jgi:CubicO group peptidase (beta-lactamase class C family)
MTTSPEIHGICPPRFAAVQDAFAANFTGAPEGLNEQAARFSVVIGGETVVDLMAGLADPRAGTPYGPNSLTPVFSTGKAVMALMIATCVERGLLDYDQRVADLWPAYGAAGKQDVTVAQMMSHQDGLPGFTGGVEPEIWFDRQGVLDRLAAQAPMWAPGTASGYHPITIGYLAGELFRLADGRTLGAALKEDFRDRFGLDLWVGLPESEHDRVAALKKPSAAPDLGPIDDIKRSAFLDRGSAPGGRGSKDWREAEIPSANLHGTALDLARIMGVIANDGVLDGQAILSPDVVDQATTERIRGQDKVLPFVMSWAAGFTRNAGLNIFGPNPDAVGHCGWGGSCVMADPDARVSAAYVMTRQSSHLLGDPRAQRLIDALYSAL